MCAAYRLLIQKKPPSFVWEEMQKYDWDPDKDRVLPEYLNTHMAELSQLLVEVKVLDSAPNPLPVLAP